MARTTDRSSRMSSGKSSYGIAQARLSRLFSLNGLRPLMMRPNGVPIGICAQDGLSHSLYKSLKKLPLMAAVNITIKRDDLTSQEVIHLIIEHIRSVAENAGLARPKVFDIDHLPQNDVLFWTAWVEGKLAGIAALMIIDQGHGELRSFRTVDAFRRMGIGSRLLDHITEEAIAMGLKRLSLGTGKNPYYQPAVNLYKSRGFYETEPFGDYHQDPYSYFLTREI